MRATTPYKEGLMENFNGTATASSSSSSSLPAAVATELSMLISAELDRREEQRRADRAAKMARLADAAAGAAGALWLVGIIAAATRPRTKWEALKRLIRT